MKGKKGNRGRRRRRLRKREDEKFLRRWVAAATPVTVGEDLAAWYDRGHIPWLEMPSMLWLGESPPPPPEEEATL
jgi:hypothetical protein